MIVLILTFATTLVGQDPIGRAPAPVPPEVQQRLEQQRQRHEKMRKPDFLRMELAPAADDDEAQGKKRTSYKAGEKILVQVVLINNSPETVDAPSTNPYYQNRPQLVRGAQTVAYREDVAELIEAKEPLKFLRVDSWELEPLKPQAVEILDLSDWYGPLPPGVYRLTLRRRLVEGGDWIGSAPLVLIIG